MPVHLALDIAARANIVFIMPRPTPSARLLKTALGLAFIIPGAAFTIFLWVSYARAQETRRWAPTPCVVLTSQVISEHPSPHSPTAHRASIRYRYVFDGIARTGDHILRVDGSTSEKAKAEQLCAEYPAGRETKCFVNPRHPDSAVLEHSTKAGLYTIWFPLLFVAGGAGMVWSAWRSRERDAGGDDARSRTRPPSARVL